MYLPEEVSYIIHKLEEAGYEAYAVGGCVRDALLGREPDDWDITTEAPPERVMEIFPRTFATGLAHGTVTVRVRGRGYEVTTYRIDGEYSDGRHPDSVEFTTELQEDLCRRDFTVNAMAYHPRRGLVDLFGGKQDLEKGVIRCVGDPGERFGEDALRMLRALRFSAQLDFAIEEETFAAIGALSASIGQVSAERIRTELVKLLVSGHPERMADVAETGLSAVFFPEWDALFATPQHTVHHDYDVGRHTIAVLCAVPPIKRLRLAALLHDIGKPLAKKTDPKGRDHFVGHPQLGEKLAKAIMRRLKFDNDTIRDVAVLVRYHDERPQLSPRNVRRLASRVGAAYMEDLIALKRADIIGQSDYLREEKLAAVDALAGLFDECKKQESALTLKDLAINGRDLMEAGIPGGKLLGSILKELLSEVVDDPDRNNRKYLSARAVQLSADLHL